MVLYICIHTSSFSSSSRRVSSSVPWIISRKMRTSLNHRFKKSRIFDDAARWNTEPGFMKVVTYSMYKKENRRFRLPWKGAIKFTAIAKSWNVCIRCRYTRFICADINRSLSIHVKNVNIYSWWFIFDWCNWGLYSMSDTRYLSSCIRRG